MASSDGQIILPPKSDVTRFPVHHALVCPIRVSWEDQCDSTGRDVMTVLKLGIFRAEVPAARRNVQPTNIIRSSDPARPTDVYIPPLDPPAHPYTHPYTHPTIAQVPLYYNTISTSLYQNETHHPPNYPPPPHPPPPARNHSPHPPRHHHHQHYNPRPRHNPQHLRLPHLRMVRLIHGRPANHHSRSCTRHQQQQQQHHPTILQLHGTLPP